MVVKTGEAGSKRDNVGQREPPSEGALGLWWGGQSEANRTLVLELPGWPSDECVNGVLGTTSSKSIVACWNQSPASSRDQRLSKLVPHGRQTCPLPHRNLSLKCQAGTLDHDE